MALPWIKLHTSLPRHPKSIALAEYLGVEKAWPYVVELWLWCAEFAPSGCIEGDPDGVAAKVARAAGWPRSKAADLVDGLVAAGFVDRLADGRCGVQVHDWDEHQLSHLEKAKKDADRKRKLRAAARPVLGTSAGHRVDGPRDGAGRGEERRGEEKREDSSNMPPPPEAASPAAGVVKDKARTIMDIALPMSTPKHGTTAKDLQGLWNALPRPGVLLKLWPDGYPVAKWALFDGLAQTRALDEWGRIIDRIGGSAFCNGAGRRDSHVWTPEDLLGDKGADKLARLLAGHFDGPDDFRVSDLRKGAA